MSERPILFSGSMVRAILAGQKTMTRRAVKYSPVLGEPDYWCCRAGTPELARLIGDYRRFCPYGLAGDRLWVRETWAHDGSADHSPASCWYRADPCLRDPPGIPCEHGPARWTPGIHMFRWASRITLEVTGIRVERLQAITEEDARAEGVERREHFARLWDEINGPLAFDQDPWVWVVEFRRVTTTGERS